MKLKKKYYGVMIVKLYNVFIRTSSFFGDLNLCSSFLCIDNIFEENKTTNEGVNDIETQLQRVTYN